MAAAAPRSRPLLLLLGVLTVGLAAGQLCRNNATSFRFDSFDCFRDRQLICTGDATTTVDGQLNLTRYDMKSWGRVMVAQGFRLMDRTTSRVAYFSTNFTFSMKGDYSRPGEGMAFVMQASRGYQGHSGGFLGIFDNKGKAATPTVAVEFDTFREWIYGLFLYNDINNNHVGVDIESINSKAQVDAGTVGIELGREKSVTAWIDYVPASETSEGNLQVRISVDDVKPFLPLISYDVDLSKHMSEIMYLGFSATTGDHMVTSDCLSYHNILSWSFDSWWEDSESPPASPPASPPIVPPPSIFPPVPLPPEPPSPALPSSPAPSPSPSPGRPIVPSPSPSGSLPPFSTPPPPSFPSPTWSPAPTPSSVSPPSPYKPVPPGPVPAPTPVLPPASSPSSFPPAITPSLSPQSSPSPSADSAPSTSPPAAPASIPSAAPSPGPGNANSTDSPAPAPTPLPPPIPAPAPSSSSSSAPPPSPATPHLDATRPMVVSIAAFALLFSVYAVAVYTRVLSELGEGRRWRNLHRLEYIGDQTMIGIWPTDR
ncbi:hypothetical protein R1sor_008074 [Riccia sorocarpa]|uniref:Legume lectin domain-containing protein n=1 Tax=Riccia sorocarpa TaxID=122646 RepID=A0ABD3HSJ4_9MARC